MPEWLSEGAATWAQRKHPQVDPEGVTIQLLAWCRDKDREPDEGLWTKFIQKAAREQQEQKQQEPSTTTTRGPTMIEGDNAQVPGYDCTYAEHRRMTDEERAASKARLDAMFATATAGAL